MVQPKYESRGNGHMIEWNRCVADVDTLACGVFYVFYTGGMADADLGSVCTAGSSCASPTPLPPPTTAAACPTPFS